jgi:hypothetical protein
MQGMENTLCSFAANSVESSRLHFSGDLTWWLAAILAAVGGLAALWIYRGDIKGRSASGLWLLPALRVGVIVLVMMMLSGPVLRHTTSVGTTARVLLYVDASASMKATDEQMELPRKLRIIRRLGWIKGGAPEDHATDALDRLSNLRQFLARVDPAPRAICRRTFAKARRSCSRLWNSSSKFSSRAGLRMR